MRARRKKADKDLPSFKKVDCVEVSFAPLKASIEDQHNRFADAMLKALERAVLDHIKDITTFMETSSASLMKQPQSIQDIANANTEWNKISGLDINLLLLCQFPLLMHDSGVLTYILAGPESKTHRETEDLSQKFSC